MMKWIFLAVCLLVLPGCDTLQEARLSAQLLSAHTNGLRAELEAFASARDAVAQARQANINALESSTLERNRWTNLRRMTWSSGELTRARTELIDNANTIADTDLAARGSIAAQREEHLRLVEQARSRVTVKSSELSDAANSLAVLSENRSLEDTVSFYQGFLEDVRESLEEAKQHAAENTIRAKEKVDGIDEPPLPPGLETEQKDLSDEN